jgi:hypothetical protein
VSNAAFIYLCGYLCARSEIDLEKSFSLCFHEKLTLIDFCFHFIFTSFCREI